MTTRTNEEVQQETKPEPTVRVLRAGTCQSLSGKSTLTYELGADGAAELQLRIAGNSAAGMFSPAWVPWERVRELLVGAGDAPVTSHTLAPLYGGTSANSPGFLLAALLAEGVVRPLAGGGRGYERADSAAAFLERARVLIGGGDGNNKNGNGNRNGNGNGSGNGNLAAVRKGPKRAAPPAGNREAAGRPAVTLSAAATQVGLPTPGAGKKAGAARAGLAGDFVGVLAGEKPAPSKAAKAKPAVARRR